MCVIFVVCVCEYVRDVCVVFVSMCRMCVYGVWYVGRCV